MEELWYKNPKILTQNLIEFFPNKEYSKEKKINSMVRFAIYYAILLIIFKLDSKWLAVSAIIILISLFLGKSESFTNTDNNENCTMPTKDNPFMNFNITNPNKFPACMYDDVKDDMREKFRSKIPNDPNDLWGRNISDRNFYTMPNTDIVNDQTGFAEWCFGDSGSCKMEGKGCLKVRDPVYHRGRITNDDE
jgi:hypothetical protein